MDSAYENGVNYSMIDAKEMFDYGFDEITTVTIAKQGDLLYEAELKNQAGVDDFDTYHLMDEVNDLIVKGYSGNLEFERDFLAEATDMLNRMYG